MDSLEMTWVGVLFPVIPTRAISGGETQFLQERYSGQYWRNPYNLQRNSNPLFRESFMDLWSTFGRPHSARDDMGGRVVPCHSGRSATKRSIPSQHLYTTGLQIMKTFGSLDYAANDSDYIIPCNSNNRLR